ncbi:ComF family protein [Arthrobacter sp. ISL-28]|nr:ComF family protein [Arthrobacter sp. ISL-28]
MRAAELLSGAAAEVMALAVPVECVCCGKEDRAICSGCERKVRLLTRDPFRAESTAPALVDTDGSVILPVVAAGIYREELAQSVLAFKRHGQGPLTGVLAKALGRAILAAAGGTGNIWLVPVPSSGRAYRKRGFSQVHLLLKYLRFNNGLEGLNCQDVLRKTKVPTVAAGMPGDQKGLGGQKGLGRGDRARRVRGSMRAVRGPGRGGLAGRPCIIVDDVLTTGSTLAEAARALHEAGGVVRGAVVLAATRPPDAGPISAMLGGPQAPGDIEKNKGRKDE